jgi:hypothetical protein
MLMVKAETAELNGSWTSTTAGRGIVPSKDGSLMWKLSNYGLNQ